MAERKTVGRAFNVGRAFLPAAGLPRNVGRAFLPAAGLLPGARRPKRRRSTPQSGQATLEFILAYAGILLPATFALLFTAQLLWVWHSVALFTGQGARYAATHCWQADGSNVLQFMRSNAPLTIDQAQFINGPAQIVVSYFGKDPDSGQLIPFTCDTECSVMCIPASVTVSITNYEFRNFVTALGLPPVPIPDFRTSVPIESAGCDPEQGACLP